MLINADAKHIPLADNTVQCIQVRMKSLMPLANMYRMYQHEHYKHHADKVSDLEEAVKIITGMQKEET